MPYLNIAVAPIMRVRALICAAALTAMILVPLSAWAGEQIVGVDVQAGFELGGSEREQAMLLALVRESETVLPGSLDPARKELLAKFMQTRHEKYILSYSQLARSDPGKRVWQIQVNTQAQATLLKDLGIYYTLDTSLSYSLELVHQDDRGAKRIAELEVLSGLNRGNVQYPSLRVQATSDGGWNGRLQSANQAWTANAKDVDDLWLALWSNFFSYPESMQSLVQSLDIRINGWSTISAISGFCQQLQSWPQLVDRATLGQISGDSLGLHAHWQILTLQPEKLKERLDRYTRSRGLDWNTAGDEHEAQ